MANTTVKRNWKKKISAICEGVSTYTCYSLDSNFEGVKVDTDSDKMKYMVEKYLKDLHRSTLTYNKETGSCCLHIHSNLWYDWSNKINW